MKRAARARSAKKRSKKAPPPLPAAAKKESLAPTKANGVYPIVGIGASAGGLEAFTQLLKALPEHPGMAFVLVPHLDPTHESAMKELLSHATRMPVMEVSDGLQVEPDTVYVIPPNSEMTIEQGTLRLKTRGQIRTHHMPIDIFLRSLAEDQKNNAIGVILSGAASDGTQGLAAIKSEGGITFAQDPKSAKYEGMPNSAIAAGCADVVLHPDGIARELVRVRQHPYVTQARLEEAQEADQGRQAQLNRIFRLLRESSGVDFSEYKPGTIRRRILRRMAVTQCAKLSDYLRYLHQHREEAQGLYQDLLINVSSFFRNPEAFEALKDLVYPSILRDRKPGDSNEELQSTNEELQTSKEELESANEELNTVAAALAHEINNPLEALTNLMYLLASESTIGKEARKYVGMARVELERISHISKSLLGLYRGETPAESFPARKVVEDVLEVYASRIAAKNVRVLHRYKNDGVMYGSFTEVRQVLLNLVGNALEAVEPNGTLAVRISPSCDWRNFSAKGIRITVANSGAGIPRELRPRVFEPFFTTKGAKGTGLGLWVSKGIVTRYGGSIRMRSRSDSGKSGSCFSVFFPSPTVQRAGKQPAKTAETRPTLLATQAPTEAT